MTHTVAIVGVGALGSHVVQLLRNEDVRLRLIDFDRIERKNTASQFHTSAQVGQTKVAALSKTMQFLWGFRNIEFFPREIVADNVEQLLAGSDLVIDCLDNAESRNLLTAYGKKGTPVLHGALAPDGAYGRVAWNDAFQSDGAVSNAPTCENGEHLPFIALTAAYLARAAQLFLHEKKKIGFQISPRGAVVV